MKIDPQPATGSAGTFCGCLDQSPRITDVGTQGLQVNDRKARFRDDGGWTTPRIQQSRVRHHCRHPPESLLDLPGGPDGQGEHLVRGGYQPL